VHLCYIDEAGTTGKSLTGVPQQPVFTMAGLLVSDEKWRKTEREIRQVISSEYGAPLPPNFELHASELLAPHGEGPFTGWTRDRRNSLALQVLKLIETRKHQVLLQWVVKRRMAAAAPPADDFGFDWKDPWELSFALALTMAEEFLQSSKTGSSSTGMVIIDHEPTYLEVVRAHSRDRQQASGWRKTNKVMEIGYSAASHANSLIQMTDLVAFTMKKWAESAAGLRADWPKEAHDFFSQCHDEIWPRVVFKTLKFTKLAVPDKLLNYVKETRAFK
jgi:hypothetical protein